MQGLWNEYMRRKVGNTFTQNEEGKYVMDFGINKRKHRLKQEISREENAKRVLKMKQNAENLSRSRKAQVEKDFGSIKENTKNSKHDPKFLREMQTGVYMKDTDQNSLADRVGRQKRNYSRDLESKNLFKK